VLPMPTMSNFIARRSTLFRRGTPQGGFEQRHVSNVTDANSAPALSAFV
jgi:hypothetical protein